jgi:oxidase EvaA
VALDGPALTLTSTRDGREFADLADFHGWFADRRSRDRSRVTRTSLDSLDGWRTDRDTGNLVHHSGRYFSVQGVTRCSDRGGPRWSQPIIVQPEVGILGLVVRLAAGRPQLLFQAKMEPGNVNGLQLSPAVQATRSNYTRVHGGTPVPHLELFVRRDRGRVVFDTLQSEQGCWFLGKRNRNMIVSIGPDTRLPAGDSFCWLTLDQVAALLKVPNMMNMDARAVLAGLSLIFPDPPDGPAPAHSTRQVLAWVAASRRRHRAARTLTPLAQMREWRTAGGEIARPDGRHFSIIGVRVAGSDREIGGWSQPMLKPSAPALSGFRGRPIDGVFHVLVQARAEAGTFGGVEVGPTVSCIPADCDEAGGLPRPRYLDAVRDAPAARRLVDVVHSEEGGRFFHAESRYVVVDVGEGFGTQVPPDFCWMTIRQLTAFVRVGNQIDVGARCLLACLTADDLARRPAC